MVISRASYPGPRRYVDDEDKVVEMTPSYKVKKVFILLPTFLRIQCRAAGQPVLPHSAITTELLRALLSSALSLFGGALHTNYKYIFS